MNIRHQNMPKSGFSLVELLTVVAIISILSALSIPSYMNYLVSTKVNAMWQQAEAAKLEIQSQYLKNYTSPTSITVDSGTALYTQTTLNYVQCITIQSGVVSVVANPSDFNSAVLWISWTPTISSGLLGWTCNYSSAAAQYVADSAGACSVGTATYSADSACP